jgi:hypothetical protein
MNRRRRLEPTQPLADEREPSLVDGVHAGSAAPLVVHEAGVLEHAQVPRGRGPLVRKASGDLTGGGGAPEVDRQKDLSPRRMRQRGDDGVERR